MAITTSVFRCWGLIGASNADGLAATSPMFANYPHLAPGSVATPSRYFWRDLYVFTSALPWPEPNHTPVGADIAEGEWLEMTANVPLTPNAPHPHASPYFYPNTRGMAFPNWSHVASAGVGGGTLAGLEIPFAHLFSNRWADQTGLIKVALSSTYFWRYEPGLDPVILDYLGYSAFTPSDPSYVPSAVDSSYGYYGYWTPIEKMDWSTTTNRLYNDFIRKCIGAKEALPAGTRMDMRVVIGWMFDNDSLKARERVVNAEADIRAWIKKLRQDLFDNECTTLSPEQIMVILFKVPTTYTGPDENAPYINAALDAIAEDDEFVAVLETDDYETLTVDNLHVSDHGYIQAAQDAYEAMLEMEVEPFDALPGDERITVEQLQERVRLYYTRSKANTDVSDELVLQHINAAMFHVLSRLGDNAWWLRRRMEFSLDGGGTANPITLPRVVHRIMRIEDPSDTTFPLQFQQLAHVDGGKLQIVLPNRTSGTYVLHFIKRPQEMKGTGDLVPIPYDVLEWLVVEACFRLARAASNVPQMTSFKEESKQLEVDVLKLASQMQRSKNDKVYTARKLTTQRSRRRVNRWANP